MRRPVGAAWAAGSLLAVAVVTAVGCRGGGAHESRPPAEPSSLQVPVAAAFFDAGGSADDGSGDGMPSLVVVLDDPRLRLARDRAQVHDESAAAREVERVQVTASLTLRQTIAWSYVAGRLHLVAGEDAAAAAAFDAAALATERSGVPSPLASYSRLREAEALLHAGRYDDAIASVHEAGGDGPSRDEARLALGDALAGKGDRAAAVPIWRAVLTSSPHGVRWVETSLALATALLDGVEGPYDVAAQEALDRVDRVLVEAPVAGDKLNAADVRARAVSACKAAPRHVVPNEPPVPAPGPEGSSPSVSPSASNSPGTAPPPTTPATSAAHPHGRNAVTTTASCLTPEERLRQAQSWFEAQQPKKAREAADEILASIPRGSRAHHGTACSAAILRAQATPHGKSEDAASAWGSAITRCEGEDALVTALYYGGRSSASAKRGDEAMARFGRVEKLFPRHRLADDARFRAAFVVLSQGNEAKSLAMLESMPDAYPDGDMRGEALFRVALTKLEKHDLDGARAVLDRSMLVAPDPPTGATAHRADYFRARVAELAGNADDARRRYAGVIAAAPLDYYMLLAYTRLRRLDDGAARAALEAAVTHEPSGTLVGADHAELTSPAFERFVALLEVGEIDAARREANAGGLVAEGVDPEVLWTVGWAYDRAGAPDLGHAVARGRLSEFRTHWPAGRWRIAWQVAFPRAWDAVVTRESESTRIPSPLTWAIMREESAFNPDAKSAASAIGLMQLIVPTARLVAHDVHDAQLPFDEQALRRPEVSIALGAHLLSSLRTSFPAHPAFAIAAYNGGAGAVRRWLGEHGGDDFDVFVEHIPFDETRAYVKRVLGSEAAYAYLYAPAALDEILSMPIHLTQLGPDAPAMP